MAGVLYNKFLIWARNDTERIRNETESDFFDYIKTVYRVKDPETNGILNLLSTFIAPSVEQAAAKQMLHDATCKAGSRIKREATVCPDGWTQQNKDCFKVFTEYKEWKLAQKSCNDDINKAHLSHASGKDLIILFENNYREYPSSLVWVGGIKKSDVWWWEDDRPIGSIEWRNGTPSEMRDGEVCMNFRTGMGMGDLLCHARKWYICQFTLGSQVSLINVPRSIEDGMYSCSKIPETRPEENPVPLPLIDIFINPDKGRFQKLSVYFLWKIPQRGKGGFGRSTSLS